ncbi:MAG: NAD(P)/FAD-dependent oxidoreductase [Candidatus Lokiarchaeota archaeon]|nr:NAD(P)/FAD-dependent oxidoreductase [Candidatus Lokiarchaeota archaeon]
MYDIIIVGAGISGTSFAKKISKYAKTLIIEKEQSIHINTNIFPAHNNPYIDDIILKNQNIFPKDHIKTNYLGKEINGIIDSEEFGKPLGKIVHTEVLIDTLIKKFQDNGGTINFDERVKLINRSENKIEVLTSKNTYYCKLLVLSTGSNDFELQKSIGFNLPDTFSGIFTNIYANDDIITNNFDFEYIFHLNPQISTNGPFYFNIGKGRISLGFLGNSNESKEELKIKLEKILQNYNPIKPYLEKLKWNKSSYITCKVSKHPINTFSQDRIVVLGEAAGLVTSFFYEGILPGLLSADLAVNTIKPILNNDHNFSEVNLNKYDLQINKILLKNYYKNGLACEYLFYNSNHKIMNTIWDTYTKLINENKRLRKEICEAYWLDDIATYDLDRDKWAGEQLFKQLPTISKISLGPKFLKALLKF